MKPKKKALRLQHSFSGLIIWDIFMMRYFQQDCYLAPVNKPQQYLSLLQNWDYNTYDSSLISQIQQNIAETVIVKKRIFLPNFQLSFTIRVEWLFFGPFEIKLMTKSKSKSCNTNRICKHWLSFFLGYFLLTEKTS